MTNSIFVVYLVIAAAAMLVGISKGGLASAIGSLTTPVLALVLPAPIAVGLTLPLFLVGDVFAIALHWNNWDRKLILRVMPATIVGVILGTFLLSSLPAITIQHLLGGAAILYTIYKLWSRFRPISTETEKTSPIWEASAYGGGAAVASTVANSGAPLFTIYLLMQRLKPSVFVSTAALYFALTNLMKVPGYLASNILQPNMLLLVAWAIPIIPFGVWSGKILDKYMDMKTFETVILVLLAFTGIILLLK